MTCDARSGRVGRQQHVGARAVLGHVRRDLGGVQRAAGDRQVVRRPLRDEAEREPEVAELEIEVDGRHAVAGVGERDGEVGRRQRLADAALGPEHADQLTGVVLDLTRAGALPARHRLLDREAQLERRLADLVGDHDVLRSGLEDPAHEAVRRRAGDDDHGSVRALAHRVLDDAEHHRRLRARDHDEDVGGLLAGELPVVAGLGDADQAEAVLLRERRLDRLPVEPGLDRHERVDRPHRVVPP